MVRPKSWLAASVKRSRDRIDRIGLARKRLEARLATAQWMSELDRRGICQLEATGIEWSSVDRWLKTLNSREAFVARRLVKHVLQMVADDEMPERERF